MRLKYNAPVTFSFALVCTLVQVVDQYLSPGLVGAFFTGSGAPQWSGTNPAQYAAVFLHMFGHDSFAHLLKNFMVLLLLGPILEEKYNTKSMAGMLIITGLVAGIFNILLSPEAVVGSSSIVFMMIMLVSFARSSPGDIPVSVILIFMLYMLDQLTGNVGAGFFGDNKVAHIVGGICGLIFGFLKMSGNGSGEPAPQA